jgi:hypothetical protein
MYTQSTTPIDTYEQLGVNLQQGLGLQGQTLDSSFLMKEKAQRLQDGANTYCE